MLVRPNHLGHIPGYCMWCTECLLSCLVSCVLLQTIRSRAQLSRVEEQANDQDQLSSESESEGGVEVEEGEGEKGEEGESASDGE